MLLAIEQLIATYRDPSVNEVIVNADGTAYVEKGKGALEMLPFTVPGADAVAFVNNLTGDDEKFGASRPYADLSAQDGARIHVIGPPLTKGGFCVTIRKRPEKRWTLDELVRTGTLPANCAGFLKYAVSQHKSILIVGGTSSGKTSLMSALCSLIDSKERILVLEDTPELSLPQPHVAYLRTRMRDAAGLPDITLRELVINTLRMRPDRIIVGEVRSVEAADLMEAMNVGNEGVMCTLHANSAREALQRIESLVLMSGNNLPLKAVRSNIVMAMDLIVFMTRTANGTRKVAQVSEVTGMDTEMITMSDLFSADTRKGPGGSTIDLRPSGTMPKFYDQLRRQGVEPPIEFFRSEQR
jgi:pilus assembly protein CpaF